MTASDQQRLGSGPWEGDATLGIIHGLIRQPVGFAVVLAIHMPNRKGFQAGYHCLGFVVQRPQVGAADFVLSGNLPGHEFRIRQHAQTGIAMAERIIQGRQQSLVFGKVVRGSPNEFRKRRDGLALRRFNGHSVGCGARIAAGSAVDVRNDFR